MNINSRHTLGILFIWLALIAVSLSSRYFIPIDETRYVTVAWNMWLRGDFLVPFLNDHPYSDKPPLLFWFMNMGWAIFGVNDWWPRLIPFFFSLMSVFMTSYVARLLWPASHMVARMAAVILFGSLLWMMYSTATMFDMMVAFFTLLGMASLLLAWQRPGPLGWLLVGAAIGLGLLAKGPTILLQILPVAVLAPWWGRRPDMDWRRWYVSMLGAVVMGAAIALLWAIPAGLRGGEAYQHAIFWGQTADRMVNSFAHQRPFWWYTLLLPILLFPWLLWGGIWGAMGRLRNHYDDTGVRFCLAWAIPVFIAFSFISGKQVHYLLPIFPAFALLAAYGLGKLETVPGRAARAGVAVSVMLTGLALLLVPHWYNSAKMAEWVLHIPAWSGVALLLCGGVSLMWKSGGMEREVWLSASVGMAMVLILHFSVIHTAGLAYDIRPISAKIKALQDAGVPLANDGKYHGQYQFAGRLRQAVEVTRADQFAAWFDAHPGGRIIFYVRPGDKVQLGHGHADFVQPYLDGTVGIYARDALLPPS
ncbi:ArnT family glycosyltransferase [Methylotenera sp. G11]|uniref:ArnT family glycosyltransferase n=1 Tax=Methylotenera sp. G11 TaxID=1506585 RepID=UPI00064852B8|nr:glycosyltransferase family 39 protein [Methylotenera sp. G11]